MFAHFELIWLFDYFYGVLRLQGRDAQALLE